MPIKSNPVGPTGQRVAEHIRSQLARRGSRTELREKLAQWGRPMSLDVLKRVAEAERPLDTDDLMAVSGALGWTPNRLLLSETASVDRTIQLTPTVTVSEANAWHWAAEGELPLGNWPPGSGESTIRGSEGWKRRQQFRLENRPDRPEAPAEVLREHGEAFREAASVVARVAKKTGIPARSVLDVLAWAPFGAAEEKKENDHGR